MVGSDGSSVYRVGRPAVSPISTVFRDFDANFRVQTHHNVGIGF